MKYVFMFFALIIPFLSFSQSNYDAGFKEGFKKGFCYERGANCIAPIAPIAPIPTVNESSDNYNHGYNRGFQIGLDKSRNEKSNANSDSNYKTAKADFIDYTANNSTVNTLSNSQIEIMQGRNLEIHGYFKTVLERLEDDAVLYKDDADIQKLYKKYRKELKKLVNYYNNNKVSILSNDNKFNACYMKIVGIISDYNDAFKEIK